MKYSICLIDDDFPINQLPELDQAQEFNLSNLKMLLNDEVKWADPDLRGLTSQITDNPEIWNISAYTNPKWYLENYKQQFYTPELLILDWNYISIDKKIDEYLKEILNQSFIIIWIYTRHDKKHEIEALLATDEYKEFRERIKIFHKEDNNIDELIESISKIKNENFSFKFGKELRNATHRALEDILINLGKISIDNVIKILSDNENLIDLDVDLKDMLIEKLKNRWEENTDIENILREKGYYSGKIHSFINMIAEKLKNILNTKKFSIDNSSEVVTIGNDVIEKLWSYRLYFNPSDDIVRRGDIIKNSENKYYLVTTAPCDLNHFWNKNFGYLNIVPIYSLLDNKDYIVQQLCLTSRQNDLRAPYKVSSLTGGLKGICEGPVVLPFIYFKNVFNNYILFPKELKNYYIKAPLDLSYVACTFNIDELKGKSEKEIKKHKETFEQKEVEREKSLKKP